MKKKDKKHLHKKVEIFDVNYYSVANRPFIHLYLVFTSHKSQTARFVSRFMGPGAAALPDDLLPKRLASADGIRLNQSQRSPNKN